MRTLQDKLDELKQREQIEMTIEKKIDRVMRDVDLGDDDASQRCGLCSIFGRRKKLKMNKDGNVSKLETRAKTLFGKRKVADPAAKLREAAVALEERIAQLEERSSEGRAETKRLMNAGKKAAALRALKKVKAVEKQQAANQASLDALELQLSMLEDAQVQKTLASALASSSKGIKSQKKLISKAESAIDDAGEAREMVTELSDVMAEFAVGNNDDDDELLAELDGMVMESTGDSSEPVAHDPVADAAALKQKHEWDDAERMRQQMPDVPSGLRRRKEEHRGLLSQK